MLNGGLHEFNEFTPIVAARALYLHVLQITDNINKFKDYSIAEHQNQNGSIMQIAVVRSDSLTNTMRKMAQDIYRYVCRANRRNVRIHPELKEERLIYQESAIDLCEDMLDYIPVCQKYFRLNTKKMLAWGRLVRDTKRSIVTWHESDSRRYQNI